MASLLLTAAVLRFHGIAERELWFDENCSYYIVHHFADWPSDGPPFLDEVGHIPYFSLLYFWTRLTSESILGLRSLSAIAGVLTVLAVARLGASAGGRTVGWMAGLLVAVHPLHVYYSQEARSYSVWILLIVLALHSLYRAARNDQRRWWGAFAALSYLAFLTHYYTLLWFPGTIAIALSSVDRPRFLRVWSLWMAIMLLACVPVLWMLVIPLSHHGARPWFHEMWRSYPPALAIPKSLWMMLPAGGYPAIYPRLVSATEAFPAGFRGVIEPVLRWGSATMVACLATLAFARRGRTEDEGILPSSAHQRHRRSCRPAAVDSTLKRPANLPEAASSDTSRVHIEPAPSTAAGPLRSGVTSLSFLGTAFLFLIAAFLNSALFEPTFIVGRYDLAAFPSVILALALLIAVTAETFRAAWRKPVRAVVTTALCGFSLLVTVGMLRLPVTNRHRTLAQRIAREVGPQDLVISLNKYVLYVLRELDELRFRAALISFPPDHDRQLCWLDSEAELADPDRLAEGAMNTLERIHAALKQNRRVWILAHGEPAGARWEVDRRLFAALRDAGIDVRPTGDDDLGLAELVASPSPDGAMKVSPR